MGLKIGIIGLPNVGKSTAFNALTQAQNAQVANYPFCTIEPNRAVVPVPDARVEKLAELAGVPNAIPATVEFVDIAGLVAGASKGEGLGNQFLGNIRDTDAILHIVRCFEDPNVVHVSGDPDPGRDVEVVNAELMLADLEQLDRKIERLSRQVKGEKSFRPLLETAAALRALLARGIPISRYDGQEDPAFQSLNREMRFLTSKPVILAANVDEAGLAEDGACVRAVRELAEELGAEAVKLSARLEEDLIEMTPPERDEFLQLAGAESTGLDQVIRESFGMLDLITFFTMNEREVRAWTLPQGSTAPQAAGEIHTDFERGFIRAEVIRYETLIRYGSAAAVKATGEMRVEGKDYVVQDGDVIYIRFRAP